jgi:hypothetical protein
VGLISAEDRRREELLRRFEAVIAGAELDDLRQLAGDLTLLGADPVRAEGWHERPDLRRPPLPDVRTFRVRADLKRSWPRIWRRLELRSDMTLDVVHRVLQRSFAWLDYHLWRFSLGGEPFSRSGQAFLCPWDAEEGEEDDDGRAPQVARRPSMSTSLRLTLARWPGGTRLRSRSASRPPGCPEPWWCR